MNTVLSFVLALALTPSGAAAVPAAPPATAGESPRHAGVSPPRWERIEAGEGAECAFGSPYSFFYRPGADRSRLLIYFEGGGACWDWVSCSGMFDSSVESDEPSGFRGIFDTSNAANPFRDFAALFIPYCTGDVHVGDATQTYGKDVGGRPVEHRGARNVGQALDWVKTRLAEPKLVVVAGASAGSYGAIFNAPRIARLYTSADLVTIGDSGVPLLQNYEEILERWGAGPVLRSAWGAGKDAPLTLERAAREAAKLPHMKAVVEITSDEDSIQSGFYLVSGSPAWREKSYALLDTLEHELGTFRSFIVAGTDHGLMRTDRFYEYEAAGTSLAEWIGRLVSGKPVKSVRCSRCAVRKPE